MSKRRYTYVTTTLAVGEDTTPVIPCEGKLFIGFYIGSVAVTGSYLSGNVSYQNTGALSTAYISAGSVDDPVLAGTKLDGASTYYKVFNNEVYKGAKRISLTSQADQVTSDATITLVFEEEV